jgi:hypothetical protein
MAPGATTSYSPVRLGQLWVWRPAATGELQALHVSRHAALTSAVTSKLVRH